MGPSCRLQYAVLSFALTFNALGCSAADDAFDSADAGVATASEALTGIVNPVVYAASLAHPEFDLKSPAQTATGDFLPSDIDWVLSLGFRLTSLDSVPDSPTRFRATFIKNEGLYARTGGGWRSGLTRSDVEAIYADTSRRIVDLVPYKVSGARRYAVVWTGNQSGQTKEYRMVLEATPAELMNTVTSFDGRVVDLDAEATDICAGGICFDRTYTVWALMIKNTGTDRRLQAIGSGEFTAINDVLRTTGYRPLEITPTGDRLGAFLYYVVEQRLDPTEYGWWFPRLIESSDPQNVDGLTHAPDRLGARYTKVKTYTIPGDPKTYYLGVLINNAPVPMSGSDNAGSGALDEVDRVMADAMKTYGIPGATLAISNGSRLIHAKGYGYSNVAGRRVATPTDLFRVASVSKVLTTSAILRMIQDEDVIPLSGQPITLDTHPFGDVFAYTAPSYRPAPNLGTVTIRNLLEHRTGMAAQIDKNLATTIQGVIDFEKTATAVQTPPGDVQEYLNLHYWILGHVVKAISGQRIDNYLKNESFKHLGLNRIVIGRNMGDPHPAPLIETSYYGTPSPYSRVAEGLFGSPTFNQDGIANNPDTYAATTFAAAPLELLRWGMSLDGTRRGYRTINDTSWDLTVIGSTPHVLGITHNEFTDHLGFWTAPDGTDWLRAKGGYLASSTHAELHMFANGIKYALISNSTTESTKLQGTPTDGNFIPAVDAGLQNVFANYTLPMRDLFSNYINEPRHTRGDVDGDGRSDLVLTSGTSWTTVPVAFSRGAGVFDALAVGVSDFPGWAQQTGAKPLSGDFNRDGLSDVALTGGVGWGTLPVAYSFPLDGMAWVPLNRAITSFAGWAAVTGVKPMSGDYNGDGFTDVALTGGANWTSVPVAFGDQSYNFRVKNYGVANFARWAQRSGAKPSVGDFDGDGDDDLALSGGSSWTSQPVAFSIGDGRFTETNRGSTFTTYAIEAGAKPIAGDFNGDGLADIALVGATGRTNIPIAFSNGDGTFFVTTLSVAQSSGTAFTTYAQQSGATPVVGDFNNDSLDDIALTGGAGWTVIPIAFGSAANRFDGIIASASNFPTWAQQPGAKPALRAWR